MSERIDFDPVEMIVAMRAMGYSQAEIRAHAGNRDLTARTEPAQEPKPEAPAPRIRTDGQGRTVYADGKVIMGRDLGLGEIVPDFSTQATGSIVSSKKSGQRHRLL